MSTKWHECLAITERARQRATNGPEEPKDRRAAALTPETADTDLIRDVNRHAARVRRRNRPARWRHPIRLFTRPRRGMR